MKVSLEMYTAKMVLMNLGRQVHELNSAGTDDSGIKIPAEKQLFYYLPSSNMFNRQMQNVWS